jgi:hypothetical protein
LGTFAGCGDFATGAFHDIGIKYAEGDGLSEAMERFKIFAWFLHVLQVPVSSSYKLVKFGPAFTTRFCQSL